MPPLQAAADKVVAVCTADWHLSLKPPGGRAESQEEWLAFQNWHVSKVIETACNYRCPILHAGDVFDRWDSPVELANHVISWLKPFTEDDLQIYAVPGNHDLPHHGYDQKHKSAYDTLVAAGVVRDLRPGKTVIPRGALDICRIELYGYPYGYDRPDGEGPHRHGRHYEDYLHVALVHKYIWTVGQGNPVLHTPQNHWHENQKLFSPFDVTVFGDNHQGFSFPNITFPRIVNCGCLFRRRNDERSHNVGYWLLYGDGRVMSVKLEHPERWRDKEETSVDGLDTTAAAEFLEELRSLGDKALDFHKAVRHFMIVNETSADVRAVVRQILEEARGDDS